MYYICTIIFVLCLSGIIFAQEDNIQEQIISDNIKQDIDIPEKTIETEERPKLTPEQQRQVEQYTQEALKNYDEILHSQEFPIASTIPKEVPPDFYAPTPNPISIQDKEKQKYLEEALKNYDGLLERAGMAGDTTPFDSTHKTAAKQGSSRTERPSAEREYNQTTRSFAPHKQVLETPYSQTISDGYDATEADASTTFTSQTKEQRQNAARYLEEALQNYDELLTQESVKEKQAEKAKEDWRKRQKEIILEYHQEALKNYGEILREEAN